MVTTIHEVLRIAMRVLALVAVLALAGCEGDGGTPPADPVPPRARILFQPLYGPIGTEFAFDASRSGDDEDSLALEVRWDWEPDGTWDTEFSLEKTALHRYDEAGTFPVRLEVRDSKGLADSVQVGVHVFHWLECAASAKPVFGTAPLTVTFDVVASGGHGIFSYFWSFGDGDSAGTDDPIHVFDTPGTYEVVLRVVDEVYVQPDCYDTLRIDVAAPPASD